MLEPSRSLFGTEAPVCFGQERRHWKKSKQIFLSIMPGTLSLSRDKDEKVRRARMAWKAESESLVNLGRSSRSSPARHAVACSMSGPRGAGKTVFNGDGAVSRHHSSVPP